MTLDGFKKMTYEEIKEKYARDESGYIYCHDCPLYIEDETGCSGYDDSCNGFEKAYARIQQYLDHQQYLNSNCHQYLNNEGNTVILYVEWGKKKVLNEHEYNEMLRKLEYTNDNEFSDWLNLHYSAAHIFKMDEEDKKDVAKKFLAKREKDIKDYKKIVVNL